MDHVCGIAGEMLSRITMTTLLLEARLEGINKITPSAEIKEVGMRFS